MLGKYIKYKIKGCQMAKINYNYEKRAREIEKEKKKEEKLKKKEVLNNSKKAEEVPSSTNEKSKE